MQSSLAVTYTYIYMRIFGAVIIFCGSSYSSNTTWIHLLYFKMLVESMKLSTKILICCECFVYIHTNDSLTLRIDYDEEDADNRLKQILHGINNLGGNIELGKRIGISSLPCECCGLCDNGIRYSATCRGTISD